MAQRLDANDATRLAGARGAWSQPPPQPPPAAAPVRVAEAGSAEGRALAAAGFVPFLWPAAVLALVTAAGKERYVRKQSLQAIGFNLGMAAIWIVLHMVAVVPLLGWTIWG
ncbi:MAG: hypothetical protein KGM44_08110, partial [bacterium]|nr:hypothetical protein [bacterium]